MSTVGVLKGLNFISGIVLKRLNFISEIEQKALLVKQRRRHYGYNQNIKIWE
jgi:hypothetical protein